MEISMIEKITHAKNLEKACSRVFSSTDPFSSAAQSHLPVKAVIYPTYGYYLTELQFNALIYANKAMGSNEFFISQVEYGYNNSFVEGEHWRCIDPSFKEYSEVSIGLENAIYSVDGTWGILISHEDHALWASSVEFWGAFKSHYPDWIKDYFSFLEKWKNLTVDKNWLKDFLNGLTVKP
jgi:hypothetical protein